MTGLAEKESGWRTSPPGKPLWVYKTGLLMFRWQGQHLHSDKLPNGGEKKQKHSLSGQHSGEENTLSKPWLAPNQCCNLRLNHRKGCRVHTKRSAYPASSVSEKSKHSSV